MSDAEGQVPLLIKRYSNRKLYDTARSRYITLDELAEIVRGGQEVQVIDNKSKEDLTNVTLAQILYAQQKREKKGLSRHALRNLVQAPAELFQRFSQPVSQLRGEAVRQVGRLKAKANALDEGRQTVLEAIEALQRNLEEMQKRVDERVREALDAFTHMSELKREMNELRQRVVTLEARLGVGEDEE